MILSNFSLFGPGPDGQELLNINMKNKIKTSRIIFKIHLILCIILISGCARNVNGNDAALFSKNSDTAVSILNRIEDINKNSPKYFSLDLFCMGTMNNKKFKSTGKVKFNREPAIMKITFYDAIFRSPLTIIVQDGELVKFYFPIDKTMFIDSIDTIKLERYSNIDLDYKLVSDLAVGRIPLLDKYTVKKTSAEESNRKNSTEIYIILENDNYYETIVLQKNIPTKILLINKGSKSKTEIYLEKPVLIKESLIFKKIIFKSLDSNFKIITEFKNIHLKKHRDTGMIRNIKLPRDCKIIYNNK